MTPSEADRIWMSKWWNLGRLSLNPFTSPTLISCCNIIQHWIEAGDVLRHIFPPSMCSGFTTDSFRWNSCSHNFQMISSWVAVRRNQSQENALGCARFMWASLRLFWASENYKFPWAAWGCCHPLWQKQLQRFTTFTLPIYFAWLLP